MEKIEKFISKYNLLVIFVLAIPAVIALLHPGYFGASDDLHIGWLHELDAALKTGQFPPRYVPNLSYGFGYPLFNFVFPLPFYLAEIFHLVGFSLVDSIKTVFLLSVPLSGYFMYRMMREFCKPILAIAAGVVYMYTPYRSTDIYVRGAMGEIVAFIFLPLLILSVFKVTQNLKSKTWVGILGISLAFLVLSHNIMSYMFIPFLLVLILMFTFFKNKTPLQALLPKIFFGLLLGLLISSYFWLPAIVESKLMVQDSVFDFKDHYPTLKQLVTPYFGYGASVPGPYDGMSFFVGVINLLLVGVGGIALVIFRKKLSREQIILTSWGLGVFFVSVLFMNFRSIVLWEHLPFVNFFQFPWRFLSMTTLVTPILIIVLDKVRFSSFIALVVIVGAIVLNFSYFHPHDFLERMDDYYLDRYIPVPVASDAYKQTGEEYLRLPTATSERPTKNYPIATVESGEINNLTNINSLDVNFEVDSPVETRVDFNRYSFPGWQAKVNGENVGIISGKPFGQVTFRVPEGVNKISVKFRETNLRLLLDLVSLLSILTTITIIVGSRHAKEN